MTQSFDILGLGCVAVDDVIYVPSFPPADSKVQVTQRLRRCGGLSGAALVTASRLGARCSYAGCLGLDELSEHIVRNFQSEMVDVSCAPRLPEARVIHSIIVVGADTGSRNIFFEADGMLGAHPSLPSEDVIRGAKVLLIDHLGMPGNLRAVRAARSAGVAVVADFEDETASLFASVLPLVDHLILCEAFACRITQQSNPALAALKLWQPDRALVLVTCGVNGCWCICPGNEREARHYPAFAVRAWDTTGCGDVFHGAYAASLARGDSLSDRIRFASAAAALKAMQVEIPTRSEVEAFLLSEPKHYPAPVT
jgi:sulfofructose kinase